MYNHDPLTKKSRNEKDGNDDRVFESCANPTDFKADLGQLRNVYVELQKWPKCIPEPVSRNESPMSKH